MSSHKPNDLPPEPFPWMSTNRPSGPYRMTLRTPLSEALLGSFLLVMALVFFLTAIDSDSTGVVVVGLGSFVIAGGTGIFMLIVAIARARWFRAFERAHGRRPF